MDSLTDGVLDDLQHLITNGLEVKTVVNGTSPFVVVPTNSKVKDLSRLIYNEHQLRPERIKGTVTVPDADSFCAYWNLFADDCSLVFADQTSRSVLAILDYHEHNPVDQRPLPRWGQHRLLLALRHSTEWVAWTGCNGKKFTQIDFAEFIENNSADIVRPDAASMLEMAHDLSAKSEVDFNSGVTVSNGSVRLKFTEVIKASYGNGEVAIPEVFVIGIPVYTGGDRWDITARLRWRINSGKLTFWYDLLRTDTVERSAFAGDLQRIANTLEVTIIKGTTTLL